MPTVRTTLPRRTDRRHFLGAAGAAVAGGVMLGVAEVHTAGASDGNNFLIGGDNTATNTTLLNGGTTLYVEDGGSMDNATVSVHQTSEEAVALHAEATGSSGGVAVNAFNSSSSGVAVSAANSGTGGRAIRADNLAGGPEAVLATNDVADAIAINAINHAIGGTAVNAVSSEDGTGLYASSQNGRAIYAQAGGSDETLVVTSGMSAAIVADGSTFDLVARGAGLILLDHAGVATPPTSVGAADVIGRDAQHNLWVSVSVSEWRKLAGPATAGAFHAITPTRVHDSRSPFGGPGPLATGASRTISVANSTAAVPVEVVPAGATAISYTLTAVNTAGSGWLAVTEGGTSAYTASTINWTAPTTVANSSVVRLDGARHVKVYCGGPAGVQSNFIIDILGYYR